MVHSIAIFVIVAAEFLLIGKMVIPMDTLPAHAHVKPLQRLAF